MRYYFVLQSPSTRKVDPVDRVYKEWSDGTLLGTIHATAVDWSGVMTKLWFCFLFYSDTTIVGCCETAFPSIKYSLGLMCV